MNLLKQFLRFLKKPVVSAPEPLSFGQSVLLLVKSIPVFFLFILVCTLLFIPLSLFDLVPEAPHRTLADTWALIVYAPILEELIFRLPLRNFFRNVFFPFSIFVYILTKSVLGIPLAIAISAIIIALPYIPGFINRLENQVNQTVTRFFPFIFYLFSLSFGLIHITNFEHLSTTQVFFTPVIVFYQILLGLYLGFLRVKVQWGIVYAILVHALFNSIPVLLKLL